MTEDEFIEYTKDVLKSSKEELPTLKLQLISLVRFMSAVGYDPINPDKPSQFRLREPKLGFPVDISFIKAVQLHNFGFFVKGRVYEVPEPYRAYLSTNVHILKEESKHKIVEDVYLQWSKKRKEHLVVTNKIKFMEDSE